MCRPKRLAAQKARFILPQSLRSRAARQTAALALAALLSLASAQWAHADDKPTAINLAQVSTRETGHGGIFSEARFGVMAHDVGVFGKNKEEGADLDLEPRRHRRQ